MAIVPRDSDVPAFDAKAANDAWVKELRKEDGTGYAVFEAGGFHRLNRYMLGLGEYDGKGMLDVIKTNATQQNQMKKDIDSNAQRIAILEQEVEVIKNAPVARPFP